MMEEDEIPIENVRVSAFSFKLDSKTGERLISSALFDIQKSTIFTCEFGDNEFFNRWESILVQWGFFSLEGSAESREVYLHLEGFPFEEKVRSLAGSLPGDVRVVASGGPLPSFEGPLEPLTPAGRMSISRGVEGVVNWLFCTQRAIEKGLSGCVKLVEHRPDSFLKIDKAALRALSVFEGGREGGSVFGAFAGFLNTKMGPRVLRDWLCQPLQNLDEINFRQNLVRSYASSADFRSILRGFLRRLPDFDRLLLRLGRVGRVPRHGFSLADFHKLYIVAASLGPAASQMSYAPPGASLIAETLADASSDLASFCQFASETLDLPRAEQREYCLAPGGSLELQRERNESSRLESQIEYLRAAHSSALGAELRIEETAKFGKVFEGPKKAVDAAVRAKPGFFTVLTTRKTSLLFTCGELRSLDAALTASQKRFEAAQALQIDAVLQKVAEFHSTFEALGFLCAEQDVLLAFAEALALPRDLNEFSLPRVEKAVELADRRLLLRGSWHPCIRNCVQNDCELSDQRCFITLTGPNMGGKSTYARQVALCALLAHVGAPVPAKEAEFSLLSAILTRVGAADAQLRGVSTFMAEMLDTANLLASADPYSLVIVDELGRGTSTYEGLGIAQAVAEYLVFKAQSFCIFATHFHELCELKLRSPKVANFILETIERGTDVQFLYKVVPGGEQKSFGVNIIKLLQFPEDIVRESAEILHELETHKLKQI